MKKTMREWFGRVLNSAEDRIKTAESETAMWKAIATNRTDLLSCVVGSLVLPMEVPPPFLGMLAAECRKILLLHPGADNYLEMTLQDDDGFFTVTIQLPDGLTPGAKAAALKKEVEALTACLPRCGFKDCGKPATRLHPTAVLGDWMRRCSEHPGPASNEFGEKVMTTAYGKHRLMREPCKPEPRAGQWWCQTGVWAVPRRFTQADLVYCEEQLNMSEHLDRWDYYGDGPHPTAKPSRAWNERPTDPH